MLRGNWVRGRNYPCSYPRPPSWHRQEGSRVRVRLFLCSFLGLSPYFTLSCDRPGRRAKGSLQRAVTARTADRKTGQNVSRHDLDRSNASMIKQKKLPSRLPPHRTQPRLSSRFRAKRWERGCCRTCGWRATSSGPSFTS